MRVRQELRNRWATLLLPWVLFVAVVGLYAWGSYSKHRENPRDKMMPNASQLADGVGEMWRVRQVTGQRWIVQDMKASLLRLTAGMSLSTAVAIIVGLHMGAFPLVETLCTRFIEFFSFVPPLALLPLVFIYLGVSETAKIAIVFLGTVFGLTQDIYLRVKEVPQRYVHQGYARGASTHEVLFKICLKYKLPGILDAIRLALRPGWVYLIAAELIAADAGLGYRISLVQRQIGVHIIIPYILVIATIGFLFDLTIRWFVQKMYPWSSHV